MKIQGIIHQQICQLRWHLLACFALLMALPLEEAVVNLKDGFGFHSGIMVIVAVMFSPLLTGLIACANVQGDMDQKRYLFWWSKPANIKYLISLKFFIGLFASLIIIVCLVTFGIITGGISTPKQNIIHFIKLPVLLAIMTYSLCFGCNVLIRSTARAWLVGMLLAGFLLLLPFILPLNYKDYISVFEAIIIYLVITLSVSIIAFIFSMLAAQYDRYLKTNLKGLLWVGAGLVFVLMMIFSRQVANIKVLQEKEIEHPRWGWDSLDSAGNKILFEGHNYIDINNNKISFSNINSSPYGIAIPVTRIEGYHIRDYPGSGILIKVVNDNLYSFKILAYYRKELIKERVGRPPVYKNIYEKVYLRSYKNTVNSWMPVNELDISNGLSDNEYFRITMRLIDNNLVVVINNNFVVVDITNPEELKLIDTKLNALKNRWGYYHEHRETFSIPLVPVEEIGMEDRIKLSIDLNYRFLSIYNDIYKYSIVDIHDGKIKFLLVDDKDIARYDVTRWDNENIYCKFSATRPFTILEQMTDGGHSFRSAFVEKGRLYCWDRDTLLVFDIRTDKRIRKLGHFVRMYYEIDNIAVLDNGNILLAMQWSYNFSKILNKQFKRYLCLLENPG